ncbi:MAG: NADH-quinone oxidoreductase subunit A [Deltaproteobacteria bacterium]|nr:NADH-quinone oxidoreductase subunit A [Deltaproteobacteria bacterium]
MDLRVDYIPVLILLGISTVFVTVFVAVLPWLARKSGVRVHAPNLEKTSTYECGVNPTSPARSRYSVHFYMVAIVFILFDLEAIFLYPWAAQYRALVREFGGIVFLEAALFVGILFVGFFYVLSKGVLEWSDRATSEEARRELLARDPRIVPLDPPGRPAAAKQEAA